MTHDGDPAAAAHEPRPDGEPGCDTGPAGRVAFVARELTDLWRELRGHARPTPRQDTEKDIEK